MTVSSTTTKAQYSGNGSTTVFAVPFYFLLNADLLVILRSAAGVETTQVLGTNYTLTGAGNENGGSLTMTVAPPTGTTLTILRNAAATQETDLLPNDRLPAESLETALDKLTMLVQQLDEENDRALKFAQTDSTASTTLPTAPNRANKFLSFDNNGNPIFVGATDTYTVGVEVKTATQGQTVFTLSTISYTPGINNLSVFVDGVNQVRGTAYTETNSTTVTFSQGLHAGAIVKFSTVRTLTSQIADADSVAFLQAGSGAIATNVQDRLREIVSITDFGGAPGDQDNTAAMNAAAAYLNSIGGGVIQIPTAGEWRMNWVCLYNNITVQGVGGSGELNINCIRPFSIASAPITFGNGSTVVRYCGLENLHISGVSAIGGGAAGVFNAAFNAPQALRLRGGTVSFTANRVVLYNGIVSLSIEPSTTLPVYNVRFNDGNIRNDINNSSNARCIFMEFVTQAGFATDNKFHSLKLNGPALGYAAEAVNCLLEVSDSYWDIYPERGVFLNGASGLVCYNLQLDPATSNAVVITWNDSATNPARFIRGILRHGGQQWRNNTTTGALPNESDTFGYRPLYQNSFLSGPTYITENSDAYNTDYVIAKASSFGSVFLGGAHFIPQNDSDKDLGRSNRKWANGYIGNLRPGAGTVVWTSGSGSPEGAVTAAVGSLYTRTDGGANTTLYVKESGSGNTGWVAK